MKFSVTLNKTIVTMMTALMTSPSAAAMALATNKMMARGFARRMSICKREAVRFALDGSFGPYWANRRFAST
jgi:hypothetical protein